MSLDQALAQQPQWVQLWVVVLTGATVLLPLVLLWWRGTRLAAFLVLAATVAGGVGVQFLFDQVGYTRLLGLPHLIVWGPALVYLIVVLRRPWLAQAPRIVGGLLATVLAISLAFDAIGVARYARGDRAVMVAAPPS